MQKVLQKQKIDLDKNLPKPSKWDVKEFSQYFNNEEINIPNIKFLDGYYFDFRELDDYKSKFNEKKVKEYDEKIHIRALEDSKKLGIDLYKELDNAEIKKLKEDFYLKSEEEKSKELRKYSHNLRDIYIKVFRNKFLFDLSNESFLPKNPKIYYSSIPLSKNIKTFKDILFYMDIIKHGLTIVQFQFPQILFGN